MKKPFGAGAYWIAFAIILIAFMTDWCDGVIARKRNEVTRLGGVLDATCDKVPQYLAVVAFAVTGVFWQIVSTLNHDVIVGSLVLLFLVVGRDVFLAIWCAILQIESGGGKEITAGWMEKARAVAMVACVMSLLLAVCLFASGAYTAVSEAVIVLWFTMLIPAAVLSVLSMIFGIKRYNEI